MNRFKLEQQQAIQSAIYEAIIEDDVYCTTYLYGLRQTMHTKIMIGASIEFLRNLYNATVTNFCLQSQMRQVSVEVIRAVAEMLYRRHERDIQTEIVLLKEALAKGYQSTALRIA